MNEETKKNLRRIELFEILKNNISFDQTINENGKFSAISAYMDKINKDSSGISFAIDTENDFVEFLLTYDEARILGKAVKYMLDNIKDSRDKK